MVQNLSLGYFSSEADGTTRISNREPAEPANRCHNLPALPILLRKLTQKNSAPPRTNGPAATMEEPQLYAVAPQHETNLALRGKGFSDEPEPFRFLRQMRHETRGFTRQNELNLAARAFHGNSRSTGAAGQRLLASIFTLPLTVTRSIVLTLMITS